MLVSKLQLAKSRNVRQVAARALSSPSFWIFALRASSSSRQHGDEPRPQSRKRAPQMQCSWLEPASTMPTAVRHPAACWALGYFLPLPDTLQTMASKATGTQSFQFLDELHQNLSTPYACATALNRLSSFAPLSGRIFLQAATYAAFKSEPHPSNGGHLARED